MTIYRLLVMALCLCTRVCVGAEPVEVATIPYRHMCTQLSVEDRESAQRNGKPLRFNVRSVLPGVTSKDIRLKLRAGTTSHDVSTDENGDFTLVCDQALIDADAVLISNQPKGSLILHMSVSVPQDSVELDLAGLLSNGRIAYARLYRAALAKTAATVRGTVADRLVGIKPNGTIDLSRANDGTFEPGDMILILIPSRQPKDATARLEKNRSGFFAEAFSDTYPDDFTSITGESLLRKDRSGNYRMVCTRELLVRNPDIVLSTAHNWKCMLIESGDFPLFGK